MKAEKTKLLGTAAGAVALAFAAYFAFFTAPDPLLPAPPVRTLSAAVRKSPVARPGKNRVAQHKVFRDARRLLDDCVPEERLQPLRNTGAAKAVAAPDPALPPERQLLLLKRCLTVPEKKSPSLRFDPPVQTPSSRGTVPRIVMTSRPLKNTWADSLTGVTIRGFLPPCGWLAETTEAGLKTLYLHPDVIAVEEWRPEDKTPPALDAIAANLSPDDRLPLTIRYFSDADSHELEAVVRGENGTVLAKTTHERWCTLKAVLPVKAITALAGSGAVQWIEEAPKFALNNLRAVLSDAMNVTNVWHELHLTGEGQVIGHADTGLDSGSQETLHPDLTNAVLEMLAYARSTASDENGHGTHTAGSIVGDGSADSGKVKAPAWRAKLVHQSIVDEDGYFCDFNVYTLFSDTLEYGTTIHSDSWGDTINLGIYNSDCQDADLFAWDNPQFLPVFASGNFGTDADGNGVIDTGSVSSPSCAKNVLSVGACENHQQTGTGGHSSYTWNAFNSSIENRSYKAEPIKSDYVTVSADTENHLRGMAAFSGRGPTSDGRVKPDIVAPGSSIYSCRAGSGSNRASYYTYASGTSSATPLAAGCAALVRQHLQERHQLENPSAALVKAMLINGARSLSPGQYGTGKYREIPEQIPNNVEGWGLVDIGQTVAPETGTVCALDNLDVAETVKIDFDIEEPGAPFSATLVWTDYPGTPGAGKMLVNDLDLSLTLPDGTVVHPNSLSSADRTNTTETIRLSAAAAGKYELRISSYALPYENLSAALVASGNFAEADFLNTLTVRWVDDADTGRIFKETATPFNVTQNASTEVAPPLIWVEEDNGELMPYVFGGWELDGQRQPDDSSAAANPLSGISMSSNRLAVARYVFMFSEEYFYGAYFYYTWWNKRYFGGSASLYDLLWTNDPDGDGVINAFEMFDCTDPRDASDFPTEPVIRVNTLPVFNTARPPWPVTAQLTDNFVVADAHLLWKHKGEAEWRRTQLIQFSDTEWGAYLAPTNYGNTRIDYCICAADWLQYNLYQETTGEVYSVIGDYSEPWPKLTPTNLPSLKMYGESAQIELTLENLAGTDLEWTLESDTEPAGEWFISAGAVSGSIPARGRNSILFEIDSSKLEVGTEGTVEIRITHNEPGVETRAFTVRRLASVTEKRGVPIAWMRSHGIDCEDYEAAAESDFDGDGMPTWREWHADTDPLDPDSVLSFFETALTSSDCSIAWKGGQAVTQYLQQASSPTGLWSTCKTLQPPTAITNRLSFPRSETGERIFFRISVPLRGAAMESD